MAHHAISSPAVRLHARHAGEDEAGGVAVLVCSPEAKYDAATATATVTASALSCEAARSACRRGFASSALVPHTQARCSQVLRRDFSDTATVRFEAEGGGDGDASLVDTSGSAICGAATARGARGALRRAAREASIEGRVVGWPRASCRLPRHRLLRQALERIARAAAIVYSRKVVETDGRVRADGVTGRSDYSSSEAVGRLVITRKEAFANFM